MSPPRLSVAPAGSAEATFSVFVAGQGRSVASITEAVRSVARQTCEVWDIVCVIDDDNAAAVRAAVTTSPDTAQVRIVSPSGDEAAVLNQALAEIRGDYLVWLDASAALMPDALGTVAQVLNRFHGTGLVYGDDERTAAGHGRVRTSRPEFSPVRLRSQDYLGAVRIFRASTVRAIGGFRTGVSEVRGWDLALRATAHKIRVIHIPDVLCVVDGSLAHRSAAVAANSVRAVEDHLHSIGIDAVVSAQPSGVLNIRYPLQTKPLVSILIPTRGSSGRARGRDRTFVVEAVRGIIERSSYPNVEFVVVADDETPQSVIDELVALAGERLRLVRWSKAFNFSGKMNRGAVHARGEYLLLLNDDIDLITPDWIETMLGLVQQPGIGCAGTLLFFDDGTIQHGGHLYRDGHAGHIALGWSPGEDDALGSLAVDREVSGVTAACAIVSAELFWKVGGFSTLLPGNYNDVDFAMKIRAAGDSIVWTPHARLFHFESKSRVATIAPSELQALQRRWGNRLQLDPYWPE